MKRFLSSDDANFVVFGLSKKKFPNILSDKVWSLEMSSIQDLVRFFESKDYSGKEAAKLAERERDREIQERERDRKGKGKAGL
jgi:hypothetical protein